MFYCQMPHNQSSRLASKWRYLLLKTPGVSKEHKMSIVHTDTHKTKYAIIRTFWKFKQQKDW